MRTVGSLGSIGLLAHGLDTTGKGIRHVYKIAAKAREENQPMNRNALKRAAIQLAVGATITIGGIWACRKMYRAATTAPQSPANTSSSNATSLNDKAPATGSAQTSSQNAELSPVNNQQSSEPLPALASGLAPALPQQESSSQPQTSLLGRAWGSFQSMLPDRLADVPFVDSGV